MKTALSLLCMLVLSITASIAHVEQAQTNQAPGKSIGTITTRGNLIVFELNEGALGQSNMFDLEKRTLRFTPGAGGYRVENVALQWDADAGTAMSGSQATLKFAFPFGGKSFSTLSVGVTGSIAFADASASAAGAAPAGRGGAGGVSIARFDQLQVAGRNLLTGQPSICVFFKPRMSGQRFMKELADRVVITWSLTEPVGGIQDFTWTPTANRFQAVLFKDGTIQMSYEQVAARDAIVGVYAQPQPAASGGAPPAATNAEQDLSALKKQDGPFPSVFESFHYLKLPVARDMTCTVINALGDQFDFLAYYSDFRVDNQEAGTPSTGPLGGGPDGGAVTGIGANQRGLANYCTQGRFQWQFIQPVFSGSNQMQERPPDGLTDTNTHNIVTYAHEIGERTPDHKLLPYDYAMSQIGHEMGHRWGAFVSAKIGTETIPLGPTHWARGLQAPVAFPFQRPSEASAMGGGVWQDNLDGTFTQLDDDYYVPATGWSYLDLYLMGLIGPAEVPDFFILRNLASAGRDANGRPIFKADRTKITIQDVIAVQGPRLPDVDHSQKQFNTGIVVMVEHGKSPSQVVIDRATGIREAWIDYFATTTGHRASMTAVIKK